MHPLLAAKQIGYIAFRPRGDTFWATHDLLLIIQVDMLTCELKGEVFT